MDGDDHGQIRGLLGCRSLAGGSLIGFISAARILAGFIRAGC